MKFSEYYNKHIIYDSEEFAISIDTSMLVEGIPCYHPIADTEKYKACGSAKYKDKSDREGNERPDKSPVTDEQVQKMFARIHNGILKLIDRKNIIPNDRSKNRVQCRCEELIMSVAFSVDTENKKLFYNVLSVMPKFNNYDAMNKKDVGGVTTAVALVWKKDNTVSKENVAQSAERGNIQKYSRQYGKGYDTGSDYGSRRY